MDETRNRGLHYNRFRYYDSETAQYISPDPIGLAGGDRPYGYVHNPISWVDPLGLAGCGSTNASNKTPPGQGYHNETYAPKPVKPENAINRWDEFLGPELYTNTYPRTGLPDLDRIVSADGKKSIRYGNHEMNVDNLVIRVPILK